jgi:hypothetical protein
MTRNTQALLKIAVDKHGITWPTLIEEVEANEGVSHTVAINLVDRFKDGGPCPIVVAAAIITIIAKTKTAETKPVGGTA